MHIPDGFLDVKTAAATGVLAAAGLGMALRQARLHLPARRVPLLGLSAAFVFAMQMLNFPVAGGTSGHMVGSVLVAVLLGPSAAVIVLSSVLIVQCLVFADGGLSALGANIFNMGIIGAVLGWAIYYPLSRAVKGLFGRVLGASFAAWISTVLASIVCAGELAVSGTSPWSVAFPAMAGVHMVVGIGEAVITALVLVAIARVRPELLDPGAVTAPARPYRTVVAYGTLIAMGLALFVAPWAWPDLPDSLDRMKPALGITEQAGWRPIPNYVMRGISWTPLAISIAGVVGTVIALGLAWGLARVLVPKNPRAAASPASSTPEA